MRRKFVANGSIDAKSKYKLHYNKHLVPSINLMTKSTNIYIQRIMMKPQYGTLF